MRIRVKPLLEGNIDPKTKVLGFLYFFCVKVPFVCTVVFLEMVLGQKIWRNTRIKRAQILLQLFEPLLEKALTFTAMPTEISTGFSFCRVAPFVPGLSQSPFTLDKTVF